MAWVSYRSLRVRRCSVGVECNQCRPRTAPRPCRAPCIHRNRRLPPPSPGGATPCGRPSLDMPKTDQLGQDFAPSGFGVLQFLDHTSSRNLPRATNPSRFPLKGPTGPFGLTSFRVDRSFMELKPADGQRHETHRFGPGPVMAASHTPERMKWSPWPMAWVPAAAGPWTWQRLGPFAPNSNGDHAGPGPCCRSVPENEKTARCGRDLFSSKKARGCFSIVDQPPRPHPTNAAPHGRRCPP